MQTMKPAICAAGIFLSGVSGAAAASIDIVLADSGAIETVYSISDSFVLPDGFHDPVLTISTFSADDRGVLYLNGEVVASTGIFGPGAGQMILEPGGDLVPWTFDYGNTGPYDPVTSGFVSGENTIEILINNTGNGIRGGLLGFNPTGGTLIATLDFSTNEDDGGGASPVPLPASALLLAGALVVLRRLKPA